VPHFRYTISRPVLVRAAASFALAGLLAAAGRSAAQNYSGLQGKELTPALEIGDGLKAILGGLLAKNAGATGSIDRAVVADDRERRLVVSLSYTDWPGREIEGELLGRDKKPQPWFGRATASLPAPSGEVELVFTLGDAVPDDPQALLSSYLRVRVRRPGMYTETVKAFALRKRWDGSAPPAGEPDQIVRITPRPIGAAAQLREQPGAAPVATPPPAPAPAAPGPVRHRVLGKRRTDAYVARPSSSAAPPLTPASAPLVMVSLPQATIRAMTDYRFGVAPEIKDKAGKGPGSTPIDLLSGLRADVALGLDSVLRISTRLYQDQNPESGIVYFVPQAYALAWTPAEGYGMRMLYSAAKSGGAGEVMVAARLDAGVNTQELQLATALLNAYKARYPVKFDTLRALPIEQTPAVSLAGGLSKQYDIPADKIAVTALSDALGQIDISWVSDTVTKENIQLALTEDVGLNGSVTLEPAGGELGALSLPVRVQLADAATLGRILWRRHQPWKNDTPYPARLKYLHALLLEGNVPVVYSWSLDGATVGPRGLAELDASTIPSWLDGRALRTWIEYTPVRSCEECDQQVIAAITGGVTSIGASQVVFRTITPIADLGAYEIAVNVRSKYFDPRSRQMQVKPPLTLNADNKDFSLGPIYLVNRQAGQPVPDDPLFEYRLDVSMPDGRVHRGETWIPVDGLRVLIGKVQAEAVLAAAASGGGAQ
jgi:hypothetical protein